MIMTAAGEAQLIADEGKVAYLYDDVNGAPIKKGPAGGNPSIGIGRNLVGNPLSDDEIMYLFDNDCNKCATAIYNKLPWAMSISAVWQDVLIMVQFNTGNVFAFVEMLAAMQSGDAATASAQLLNSEAAKQLPARYGRMADAITANAWQGSASA
jgi:hypothetical protein